MNSYLSSQRHEYPDILSIASVFLVLAVDLSGWLNGDMSMLYFRILLIWLII